MLEVTVVFEQNPPPIGILHPNSTTPILLGILVWAHW